MRNLGKEVVAMTHRCIICGSIDKLIEYKNEYICEPCINVIKEEDNFYEDEFYDAETEKIDFNIGD